MPILGTSPDAIDLAEDRDRFKTLLDKLKVRQPQNGIADSPEAARAIAVPYDRQIVQLFQPDAYAGRQLGGGDGGRISGAQPEVPVGSEECRSAAHAKRDPYFRMARRTRQASVFHHRPCQDV